MDLKQQTFKLILKLGIHLLDKNEQQNIQNYNNYIIGKKGKKLLVNLDMTLLTIYNLFIFIQNVIKKNGKILFVEKYFTASSIIKKVADNNMQYFVGNKLWVGGTLTNFEYTKWYYYMHKLNIGYKVPTTIVIFDHFWCQNILDETSIKKVPVIGALSFTNIDKLMEYFIVGNITEWNSILFLSKILDLAMSSSRVGKVKYKILDLDRSTLNNKVKNITRWKRKKKGIFMRAYRKQVLRLKIFRPLLKSDERRRHLTKKLFASYYNHTTKLIGRPRWKIFKVKSKCKRIRNKMQNFVSFYERRLISVLFRFKVCKNRKIAKKLIRSDFIWVNNRCIKDKNYTIKNGDIVQTNLLFWKQKCFKRFLKKWKRKKKLKRILRRKFRIKIQKSLLKGRRLKYTWTSRYPKFSRSFTKPTIKTSGIFKTMQNIRYDNILVDHRPNHYVKQAKILKALQKERTQFKRCRKNRLFLKHNVLQKKRRKKLYREPIKKNKAKKKLGLYSYFLGSFKEGISINKRLYNYQGNLRKIYSSLKRLKGTNMRRKLLTKLNKKTRSYKKQFFRKSQKINRMKTFFMKKQNFPKGIFKLNKQRNLSWFLHRYRNYYFFKNSNRQPYKQLKNKKLFFNFKKLKSISKKRQTILLKRNAQLLANLKDKTSNKHKSVGYRLKKALESLKEKKSSLKLKYKLSRTQRKRTKKLRSKKRWWGRWKRIKKFKRRKFPRNFLLNKKYGVFLYMYTPNIKKVLIGRYMTLKRLKLINN